MTRRKAIFSLSTLCALAFSAIAAQGASASGLQFVTCVPGTGFSSEHCVPGETGTSFAHQTFAQNERTHSKSSNAKTNSTTTGPTNWTLKETIAATNLELESTGVVESLGEAWNQEVGGEVQAIYETDENGSTFNGVVVKAPAGKGCKVFEDKEGVKGTEGVIKTKPLKTKTVVIKESVGGVEKEIHSAVIEPKKSESTLFATFFIECEKGKGVPEALEGTWELTGKITCPIHGATTECDHTTNTLLNSFKGKGAKAGLSGKTTKTGGKFPITEPTHPLSVTTIG